MKQMDRTEAVTAGMEENKQQHKAQTHTHRQPAGKRWSKWIHAGYVVQG